MGAIIAVINKEGENVTETAIAMLNTLVFKSAETFGIASPKSVKIEEAFDLLWNQDLDSPIAIGCACSKASLIAKSQPLKVGNATLVFDGRIFPTEAKVGTAEAIAKKLGEIAESVIKDYEGCFAFAVAETEKIIAGRDAIGIYPLYFGENEKFAALASERKALWNIGIREVRSFPPGHTALMDVNGFRFQPVKTLTYSRAKQMMMGDAAKQLQRFLQNSVEERVSGLKEVAVAFSGGLDSCIIAFLAKKLGVDVNLVYVSLEKQTETDYAKRVAEELKLPIHVHTCGLEDVKSVLTEVLWLIEEPDPLKVSIGIPFYWAAEKTAEVNLKVLLAGQGADELFGGYKRYVNEYLRHDSEAVRRAIFSDILRMYETNFERDFKICNSHNVELRLPFVTYQMARFAVEMPVELKIERKEDGLRKLVLRQVAKNLGLPQFIVEKPKKAIQYATGVNNALKEIARNEQVSLKEYLERTFQTTFRKMIEHD